MIAHSNIILMLRVGRSTGSGTRTSHSERSQSFKAISMNFADRLKEVRLQLFLTQAEMAKLFGVTEQTIRRWEHDKSQTHSSAIRKLNEICKKNKLDI